ncbi:hypothetical protein CKAN_02557400 [Cinnamomum micranthum f. kanehirae]|uniref:Seed maturation protein PM41 n=1 Tax=Cinnamomum micranthum f. kanehirae TaxID=337451 RepID=A0A3S3NPL3_9MAGN|nr:hypothetical protein CKAN_02557400 [Cinnamomum micranthum f. kanehirae]
MSGAQGAQPMGSLTPTTYKSVPEEENKVRTVLSSTDDEKGIRVDKVEDKVEDAAGKGGPVFGAGKEEDKQDLGATGTAYSSFFTEKLILGDFI